MTATPAAAAAARPARATVTEMAVEVEGLVKRYDGRAVVDDVSLDIRRGELFALLGPNGAGKTTTVEIIEGYRRPDAGRVRVLGIDPARDARALRSRIGLMLQQGGVYPQARAREILALFASFYTTPRNPDELLDLVGLRDAAGRRYKVLSGGEKQRLGLALALVGRPELVVLDEPTAGLDPAAKVSTRALIADLRAAGVTVLLTTHELSDVERLADRLAVLDRGRLRALGTPAELGTGAAPVVRFRLDRALDAADLTALGAALGGAIGADGGRAYRVSGPAATPDLVAHLAGWCAGRGALVEELRTAGGTLEERYLELTGGGADADPPRLS
ncbi:MAG TPA: ABC transporter ATP-binding protein [Candidatus Limnocylindrales bacterium]